MSSFQNSDEQNPWTHTAAKQWMDHWKRCGVSLIPKPIPEGTQRAVDWLQRLCDEAGISQAEKLGLIQEKSPEATADTKSLPPPSRPTSKVSVSRVGSPSIALPNSNAKGDMTEAGVWQSDSLSPDNRHKHFLALQDEVNACRKCNDIVCKRQRTVFGVGPVHAKLVMFGEAPGADEDRMGEPFVGAAGQLMDKILVASGLKREDVFIMNALKCRPPNNRTPTDVEIENCRPFFEAQLETIQPDYIVCWGAVAVRAVLKSTESVGRLRGRFHHYRGAKVLVTYHPAYLLRNPDAKRLTWEDMKFLMHELGIPVPPPKRTTT